MLVVIAQRSRSIQARIDGHDIARFGGTITVTPHGNPMAAEYRVAIRLPNPLPDVIQEPREGLWPARREKEQGSDICAAGGTMVPALHASTASRRAALRVFVCGLCLRLTGKPNKPHKCTPIHTVQVMDRMSFFGDVPMPHPIRAVCLPYRACGISQAAGDVKCFNAERRQSLGVKAQAAVSRQIAALATNFLASGAVRCRAEPSRPA